MKTVIPFVLVVAAVSQACGVQDRVGRSDSAPVSEGYFTGAEGLRLFYRVAGDRGDTLVVLHGGPGMDMEYLWPDLMPLATDHTLIHYDQRGGGGSGLPEDTTLLSIEYHVRDLEALRQYFGLGRLTILAHSYGPALAALYAIDHPDRVERMVFVGPVPPRRGDFFDRYSENLATRLQPEEQERLGELWPAMVSGPNTKAACVEYWSIAMRPRLADPDDVSKLKGDPCAASEQAIRFGQGTTSPAVFASIGDWDFRSKLATVEAPVLVIHGEQEPIPMDLVEEWILALPNARLMRVPNAAHFPYVERAEIVFPAIELFLKDEWPQAAAALR
jgi:proline iminopeptidase